MKKFSFILIAIAAIFTSCSKLDTVSTENNVEYINVPIKAFINNVELTEEKFITKSSSEKKNLWCIQINGINSCHGLYTDISLLDSITLVKGEKYSITSCYTPDVSDEIFQYAGTSNKLGSPYSFNVWKNDSHIAVRNKLEYDNYSYDPSGYYDKEKNINKKFYYYHVENFIAEVGVPITIDYILVNAGFKFIFKKVEGYTYDYVNIDFGNKIDGSPNFFNTRVDLTNGEGEYTITDMGIYDPWYDEFSHEVKFGTNDNNQLFWSGNIKQKRGTIRTYTIYLIPQGENTSINISYPSSDPTEENMGNLN